MSWQHPMSRWEDGGALGGSKDGKKWTLWARVGSVPSEPNKRDVKGHSSPAGAGEHPRGPGAEL